MELFFKLAIRGTADTAGGFVGQITSNSFMKREFGVEGHRGAALGCGPAEPGGPARRDRHLRCLHPRPRHPDGDPRRPSSPPGRADGARRPRRPRGTGPAGRPCQGAWSGPRSSTTSMNLDSTATTSPVTDLDRTRPRGPPVDLSAEVERRRRQGRQIEAQTPARSRTVWRDRLHGQTNADDAFLASARALRTSPRRGALGIARLSMGEVVRDFQIGASDDSVFLDTYRRRPRSDIE